MNFPMEYPLMRFLYWLINTPGIGGVIVGLVGTGSMVAYSLTLFWIKQGGDAEELEAYAYPTPALHSHASES